MMDSTINVVDSSPNTVGISVVEAFILPIDLGAFSGSIVLTKRPVIMVQEIRANDALLVEHEDYAVVRDFNTEFASSALAIDRVIFRQVENSKITNGATIKITYTYDAIIGGIQRMIAGSRDDSLITNGAAIANIRVRKANFIETIVNIKVSAVLPTATETILNSEFKREVLISYLIDNLFIPKLGVTVTAADVVKAVRLIDQNVVVSTNDVTFSTKEQNMATYTDSQPGQQISYGDGKFPILSLIEVNR